MEESSFGKSVLKGVAGAVLFTLMLLLILALVMTKFDLTNKVYNIVYILLMTISLVIGAVFAAKCNGSKGWLVGLTVGFIFFAFTYFLGAIVTGNISFEKVQLYKLGGNLLVGTIAGMLGVNL